MSAGYKVGYREQIEEFLGNHVIVNPDTSVEGLQCYTEKGLPIRALGYHIIPAGEAKEAVADLIQTIERGNLMGGVDTELPFERFYVKKTLIMQQGDRVRIHEFVLGDPWPAELLPVYERVAQLGLAVARRPRCTLRLELRSFPRQIRAGEEFRLELAYVNDGFEECVFLNPRWFKPLERNRFLLKGWVRPERGAQPSVTGFVFDLSIFEHRTGPRAVIPSDAVTLRLGPGSRLEFAISFPMPKCTPGEHLLELVYDTHWPEPPSPNSIQGEYHSDAESLIAILG